MRHVVCGDAMRSVLLKKEKGENIMAQGKKNPLEKIVTIKPVTELRTNTAQDPNESAAQSSDDSNK